MTLREHYRRLVPEPLRRLVRDRLTARGYSRAFFDGLDREQAAGYDAMATTIVRRFSPASVVDVGCGSGGLLAALHRQGVPHLLGLESSKAGIASVKRKRLAVEPVDLARPFTLPPFDLAISLEVAEHLPEPVADAFVDGLVSGPRRLVFSAATPGQGGENHVNEQPHEYWIAKFAARHFLVDEAATKETREEWNAHGVAPWYCRNVILLSSR